MVIEPDAKDWTWVLNEPCPDCGYDADQVLREQLPMRLREAAAVVAMRLADADATDRPDDHTWSPLEYGCHVRDVCNLMGERMRLMLRTDEPTFANWDQDAAAVDDDYAAQDPETVAEQIDAAALAFAQVVQGVPDEGWDRTGLRSNGTAFTVWTLGLYALHDLDHHAWDVTGD